MEQWPTCLAVRDCHRSGYTAVLSGFPALTRSSVVPPKPLWSNWKNSAKKIDETHSTSVSIVLKLWWIHLTMRRTNGVKKQKRKIKLLIQKTNSPLCPGSCWRNESRDASVLFPASLLGSSRYRGASVRVTGGSSGIPVFMRDLACTVLAGLSGSVPTGRWCLWATDKLKGKQFKDYFIWGCAANSCC